MEKGTLAIVILTLLGVVLAQKCQVREYATKLVPACDANDLRIKWPNHEDQTKYYSCAGVSKSELLPCAAGQVFTFVLQQCTPCDRYIPPVECERLTTQQPPKCVSIGGIGAPTPETPTTGSTYPTPHYTTGSTGEGNGNVEPESTTENDGGSGNGENESTVSIESETTIDGSETTEDPAEVTKIPPPPSPTPIDPNMPSSSTDIPTPPTAAATPPIIGYISA